MFEIEQNAKLDADDLSPELRQIAKRIMHCMREIALILDRQNETPDVVLSALLSVTADVAHNNDFSEDAFQKACEFAFTSWPGLRDKESTH